MNIVLFKEEEISPYGNIFKGSFQRGDERFEHIKKILHKKEGESFDAGITGGAAGNAVITSVSEKEISFEFEPDPDVDVKKLFPVSLIVGFPRPIQLRRLLRDVAGLGARSITLCGTELGEKSYLKSNVVTDGSAEKMLIDGSAQAASTEIPELTFEESLKSAIEKFSSSEKPAIFICLDNVNPQCSLGDFIDREFDGKPVNIVAAIGSERGWTDSERKLLEKSNFVRCSMGNRILRTETAVTVALSIILDKLGFLK